MYHQFSFWCDHVCSTYCFVYSLLFVLYGYSPLLFFSFFNRHLLVFFSFFPVIYVVVAFSARQNASRTNGSNKLSLICIMISVYTLSVINTFKWERKKCPFFNFKMEIDFELFNSVLHSFFYIKTFSVQFACICISMKWNF